MKIITKMWLMLIGIIIFGTLAEFTFEHKPWIISGLLLFGVGFGYYAGLYYKKKKKSK